jgi:hypothetical protein
MSDFMTSFEQFLLWERSSRDSLEVKRIYVDMAEDLVAGIVLSQIVYWHLPSRDGKPRLQVEREGQLWLAKSRSEWWQECRISPKQADRALALLEERGLVQLRLFKFGAAPTKHVRIVREAFLRAWRGQLEPGGKGEEGAGTAGALPEPRARWDVPRRSKSISPGGENRLDPKVDPDLGPRGISYKTENTTESTTAAPRHADLPPDAAAALTEQLVAHGVSRAVARRCAREKPEVCRRCLEYLPYAEVRTTPGAWLASAIRDEYGPPPGYEKAQAARERARKQALRQSARQSHEDARTRENEEWLRAAHARLEEERGEAYRAFNDYVEGQRARAERIAAHLSPQRRQAHLAAFDQPQQRLRLLGEWLRSQGGLPVASPGTIIPAGQTVTAPDGRGL